MTDSTGKVLHIPTPRMPFLLLLSLQLLLEKWCRAWASLKRRTFNGFVHSWSNVSVTFPTRGGKVPGDLFGRTVKQFSHPKMQDSRLRGRASMQRTSLTKALFL